MIQIKITTNAKKDIAGIYKYILQDSYQNAEIVAEAIIKKIDTLARQSDLGKLSIFKSLKTLYQQNVKPRVYTGLKECLWQI